MLQHLSLFDNTSLCPHLPLYDADSSTSPIYNANTSIWSIIFSTFDYFIDYSDFQLVNVPIETILGMPLHKILNNVDDLLWTRKYSSFKARHFLIFDPLQERQDFEWTENILDFVDYEYKYSIVS